MAELALVRGFDDGVRARLRPFVTALPRFTAVNANTASPEVLAAVVEGLGLGLSLCETLAQGMNGSLTAANRPEGGAVFTLRLPLKDAS